MPPTTKPLAIAPTAPDDAAADAFRHALLAWGQTAGRRFAWRDRGSSTFELLLAEVLLARTRAAAVPAVLDALLARYPDASALAVAECAALEAILRPLGLFRKRARALAPLARALVERHGGVPPTELAALLALPYVGRYAAHAFLSFGHDQPHAVVDANVARIFERYWGLAPARGKLESAEPYWRLAEQLLPRSLAQRPYNWALLDLGALVCTARRPRCDICPLAPGCRAVAAPPAAGPETPPSAHP